MLYTDYYQSVGIDAPVIAFQIVCLYKTAFLLPFIIPSNADVLQVLAPIAQLVEHST